MRRAAAGDDIDTTVARHIRGDQIFGRHPPGIDEMFLPLLPSRIDRVVDLNPVDLRRIAMSKYNLVRTVTVYVGRPEGMSAAEPLVDDATRPQRAFRGRLGVGRPAPYRASVRPSR